MPHTPGPWEVSKIGNPYDQFMIYAESDSGRNICVAVEGEANAALISAAPDLYEAATELLEQWAKGNLSAAIQKLAKAVYKANPNLPGRE